MQINLESWPEAWSTAAMGCAATFPGWNCSGFEAVGNLVDNTRGARRAVQGEQRADRGQHLPQPQRCRPLLSGASQARCRHRRAAHARCQPCFPNRLACKPLS